MTSSPMTATQPVSHIIDGDLSKKIRTALGKQGTKVAKRKPRGG